MEKVTGKRLLRTAYERKLHIARTFRRRVGILNFEIRTEEDDDELVAFGVVRNIRTRPARRAHVVGHPARCGQFVCVIFLKRHGLLGDVGHVGKRDRLHDGDWAVIRRCRSCRLPPRRTRVKRINIGIQRRRSFARRRGTTPLPRVPIPPANNECEYDNNVEQSLVHMRPMLPQPLTTREIIGT